MQKCDICGARGDETHKCKACSKKFCGNCGDSIDEKCERCLPEDEL